MIYYQYIGFPVLFHVCSSLAVTSDLIFSFSFHRHPFPPKKVYAFLTSSDYRLPVEKPFGLDITTTY